MFGMNDNELEVEVSSDTAGFTSGMDEAMQSLGGVQGAAAAAGVAVGALSVAMAGKAVKAAADFEEAMVGVEKVTSPETAREMREEILDMANTMPIAQEELAAVAEQAGRLGVEGTENIRNFTEVATKMGVATNLSAEEAADGFARMSTLMDLDISQAENLGSAINALSNNMATSSSEIQDAALRSSGALSQLGLRSEQILALSATMNEASESAQRAGSRLRRLGQELQDPRKIEKLAEAFGMTSEEFRGIVRNNPERAIRMMARAMGEGGEQADELNQILGTESRTALAAVSQNMDGLEDATKRANSEFKNAKSLNEEYQTASDTFNNELQITKNRLNSIAITTGEALLPAFSMLLGGINDGLELIADLNEKTDGFVGTALLTAGALTGVAGAISLVGGASAAATPLVAGLGAVIYGLSGPVGWAILAVSLLAGAWASNMWNIRDSTYDALGDTAELLESFADDSKDVFETFRGNQEDAFNSELQARGDLPETEESREGDTEESAGDAGREDAEDYNSNYEDRLAELRNQGNPVEQFSPPEADVRTAGVQTGEEYWQGVQSGLGGGEEIKSSGLTPAIEKALKDGVEGYKSEDLEDAPTEINEDLFNAVAATDKGASPESLGVSQEEFNALMSRHAGGGGSSSIGDIAGGMTASGGGQPSTRTPSASSLGKHVKTFKSAVDEFAQAVDDGLTVVVETDDGEFGRAVDARVESNTRQTARRSSLRGVKQ